jgi:hypothetical protein
MPHGVPVAASERYVTAALHSAKLVMGVEQYPDCFIEYNAGSSITFVEVDFGKPTNVLYAAAAFSHPALSGTNAS